MAKDENKPYITQPRTQTDLEARLAAEAPAPAAVVNPNPFGDEAYAGTDPIYQNYANDTEKPLKAAKGVEKKAEDQLREAHKFSDDDDLVDDPGLGGKAARANVASSVPADSGEQQGDASGQPAPNEPDTSGGGDPAAPPPAPSSTPSGDGQN